MTSARAWPLLLIASAGWSRFPRREVALRPEPLAALGCSSRRFALGLDDVRNEGIQRTDDDVVWVYAIRERFAIVSKDADFHQRSFVLGHPPKVIWIQRGNCPTDEIAALLRQRHADVLAFEQDETASFLALG